MSEQTTTPELAQELSPTPYWDNIMDKYNDPFPGMKNMAMTGLLIRMAPENNLLQEDPQAYEEGLDLTIQAAKLEDDDFYNYWTVRYCAIHVLANVLKETRENPEHYEIHERAAQVILEAIKNRRDRREIRQAARVAKKKFFRK
jgi:hypothetical protein